MSSAAKLRRFGKGTAAVAIAATAMTAFGPASFAWDNPPQAPAVPVTAPAESEIGIVDTDKPIMEAVDATTSLNHGATLLQAGSTGQAIGDVRLVIPNSFRQGDRIELRLFDRGATAILNGSANSSDATKLGFASAPTVSVADAVQATGTAVFPDTEDATSANTETAPIDPWVAGDGTPPINTVKPTVKPALTPTLAKTTVNGGSDKIVLTVGNAAAGDPDGRWVVTLSGMTVDVGASVTPGELRLVPFAYDNDNTASSLLFDGNLDAPVLANRVINQYTVPAYISPVRLSASNADIISDGTAQNIGDLTLAEVHPASLSAAGPYTLDITGATIRNADESSLTATVKNPGSSTEAITGLDIVDSNTISFSVANGDPLKLSEFVISGLQLSATSPSQVRFSITGGNISGGLNGFLLQAGTGGAFADLPAAAALAAGGDGVNQDDIAAPVDELIAVGTASVGTRAIGGNNRYETARKIAKEWSPLGDEAIIASGENYPDALSSGFLSQRLGAPIILTMQGSVPADTMESLRERGVRKVYLIGGESAISKAASDKLLATPAYMWSDASKNLVPRGGNLEVVRLGGSSRYSTNALVNMYAAAQNTGTAVVGTTSPAFGSSNKTTAMIARGDNFADALTANVLTSGRNTGLFTPVGTTSVAIASTSVAGRTLSADDLAKIGPGAYQFATVGGKVVLQRVVNGTPTTVATAAAAGSQVFTLASGGLITFSGAVAPAATDTFTVVGSSTGGYVPQLENLNALPVLLTPKGELGDQAKNELSTLHIQHALIIGGSDVIPDSVVKAVDGMSITTRRLAGTDRYDTARVVNEYAWTDSVASSTNATPGLGFDGGVTTVNGERYGQAEAFLANGTRFPDALVAGPWVSRRHDAMVLVLQASIPDATKKYLTDNASKLDRAVGLGLGAAVATTVITEANRLVNSK